MKSYDFLTEGIVEDTHEMHQDHEVQMARKDCYHAAEHAIALHKLLQHVSENQGIEGWVAAKITLAADYLNTVREYLEYELMNQHSEPMHMDQAPVSVEFPIAESKQIDESKMKDLDLDLKKPPVGMTDQAFKKKYNMTKAEAKSKFSAKEGVAENAEQIVEYGDREYGGAYVNGRSDDARMTEKLTRQAKAAAKKAGKTFNTSAEYRLWHMKQKPKKQGVAEGDVVQFPKKHRGDLEDTHECLKCGGDLQGGKYMGHAVKVCIPCKQVYLPPNSNIDQNGNKIIDEKSKSQAQFRTMAAVAHNPKFAKKVGISQKVGKEFHSADKKQNYKSLPAKKVEEQGVMEMSAGSVATVVNPTPKNKAKVGTLFGGTYQREEADTPSKKRMFNKKA